MNSRSSDDDDHGPEMLTSVFLVCCVMFLLCYGLVVLWRAL